MFTSTRRVRNSSIEFRRYIFEFEPDLQSTLRNSNFKQREIVLRWYKCAGLLEDVRMGDFRRFVVSSAVGLERMLLMGY